MPKYMFVYTNSTGGEVKSGPFHYGTDKAAIAFATKAIRVERVEDPPTTVIWTAPPKPEGFVVTYVYMGDTKIYCATSNRPWSSREAAEKAIAADLLREVRDTAKVIDLSA